MDYKERFLKYKNKYLAEKMKLMSGGAIEKPKIMLFKADWCGHCKSFKGVWDQLSKNSGLDVEFITYDSEKDKELFKQYSISGFPTLLFKNGNRLIEYNNDRDYDSIRDFIAGQIKN